MTKFIDKNKGKVQMKTLLNQSSDNKNGVPLHYACRTDEDSVERVQILLDNGAELHKQDLGGRTVLHIACTRNCIKIVKFCLNQGMDIDLKGTKSGSTPLVISVINGHFELTKFLLESGADFLYEFNKQKMNELADNQNDDEVREIVNTYVTRGENWNRRRALLKMYLNRTPIAKLRIYLFRKVVLYA